MNIQRQIISYVATAAFLLILSSCSTDIPAVKSKAQRYEDAVEAVKHLTDNDIKKLVVLCESAPLSSVKGNKVLLATFHNAPVYYVKGSDNELKKDALWAVTYNELNYKMDKDKSNCSYDRIIELIGLGPEDSITDVSVIEVKHSDLYRPAYNPDVRSDNMSFTLESSDKDFIEFFNGNLVDNHYPWTALGYTYDYGREDHYGLSEFVLLKGRHYFVKDTIRIEDYIKNRCTLTDVSTYKE
ncbi:MAG: hypothetical protein ACI4UM_05245 [Succinivibrio sp.]